MTIVTISECNFRCLEDTQIAVDFALNVITALDEIDTDTFFLFFLFDFSCCAASFAITFVFLAFEVLFSQDTCWQAVIRVDDAE